MMELKAGKKIISTDKKAFVMGIVNVTPDSFYENSRGFFERAVELINQGADILDIGGESTRPGFTEVSADEEIARIIPVIKQIREFSDIPVSVDTRKSEVLKEACKYDINFLNDVSALENDADIVKTAVENELSVILMNSFSGGLKQTRNYLKKRVEFAIKNGIPKEKIILDPGIGFNKSYEENLELIKNSGKISVKSLYVLMALSRKRCIGEMTGREVEERLSGTLAADLISVLNGAKIVRVHDVKETVDSLKVLSALS